MIIEVIDINGTPHKYETPKNCPLKIEDIFAKQLSTGHYILASNDGDIFNPLRNNIELLKLKDRKRGEKRLYNLIRCSKGCYNAYITFLRSKNRTHFILAQRRFSNGI